jgi:type IX secretion system PorP/SprF family membrane protein
MKIKYILFFIIFGFCSTINAQDPIFTQYAIVPETINPGFTGFLETATAGVLHRSQWPDLDFRVETDFAYGSLWSENWNSGFGVTVLNHRENFTHYSFTQINAVYVYRVQLNDEWYFRPAIEFGGGFKSFGFGNLLLEDQININNGTINPVSSDPNANPNRKISFVDISAGMLFNKEDKIWVGLTLKHLTKPNISLTEEGNTPLAMFFSANFGYKFLMADYIDIINFPYETQMLLTANYMKQGQYNRLDFGTELIFNTFFIGVSTATNPVKNSDNSHFVSSVNVLAGLQYQHLKFGISHDFNTSRIGKTGGIYELSLSYQFDLNVHCLGCPQYIP